LDKREKRKLFVDNLAKELKASRAKKRQKKKEVVKEETPETTE